MTAPKYTRPEIERRWLVEKKYLPDLSKLEQWRVIDHYLVGTRMRLRKMVDPKKNNATQYKLCKKYGKTSSISEPIVNIYLTKTEYDSFSEMSANILQKKKYTFEFKGTSFSINTFSDSEIITIEAEFESEEQASECFLPPFAGEDISSSPEYESASIARSLSNHS
jgi:CYTH domain-containing protein